MSPKGEKLQWKWDFESNYIFCIAWSITLRICDLAKVGRINQEFDRINRHSRFKNMQCSTSIFCYIYQHYFIHLCRIWSSLFIAFLFRYITHDNRKLVVIFFLSMLRTTFRGVIKTSKKKKSKDLSPLFVPISEKVSKEQNID